MSASSRFLQTAVHLRRPTWGMVFVGLLTLSFAAYVLAPWSVESKSLAILHGLCAQRPSHSFWFGSVRLPFGSRMTGIYSGFLISQLYLLVRGRFRAGGVPSLPILSVLCLFILAMGIDGVNSTLNDIQLLTIYQPTNVLRFVTGALTGTTLAVFLWLLTSNILWTREEQRPDNVLSGAMDLLLIALPIAAFGVVAMSNWGPVYPLLALFLVISAVLVIFELAICFIQLTRHKENTARSLHDLAGVAVGSLLCAYVFMSFVAGSRFLMEATMNIRQLQ